MHPTAHPPCRCCGLQHIPADCPSWHQHRLEQTVRGSYQVWPCIQLLTAVCVHTVRWPCIQLLTAVCSYRPRAFTSPTNAVTAAAHIVSRGLQLRAIQIKLLTSKNDLPINK